MGTYIKYNVKKANIDTFDVNPVMIIPQYALHTKIRIIYNKTQSKLFVAIQMYKIDEKKTIFQSILRDSHVSNL